MYRGTSLHRKTRSAAALAALFALSALVSGCGGSGGTGSSVIPGVPSNASHSVVVGQYESDMNVSASWLDGEQLSDGAILYSSSEIEPYFANLAATGLTKIPGQLDHVRAWMQWFVAHINTTDVWNLGNTIYDYTVSGTTETPKDSADSVDSYNATFLTLARELYDTGDSASRKYVVSIMPTLENLANTVLKLQQSDGLTIAMPSYSMAYLMDNSEVYRGLTDLAYLETATSRNTADATVYQSAAGRVSAGIATLWNASSGTYAYAKGEPGGTVDASTWSVWYPDATAQIFPILDGVISPSSTQAQSVWTSFNATYASQWETLQTPDGFPWANIADTAVLMNDTSAAQTYVQNAVADYALKDFPWPWYCAEDGWYLRMMNQLQIGDAAEVADN